MFKPFKKISNLRPSLRREEKDGHSESDTVVTNSLAKFYKERDMDYPDWLGVEKHGSFLQNHSTDLQTPSTDSTVSSPNSMQRYTESNTSIDSETEPVLQPRRAPQRPPSRFSSNSRFGSQNSSRSTVRTTVNSRFRAT